MRKPQTISNTTKRSFFMCRASYNNNEPRQVPRLLGVKHAKAIKPRSFIFDHRRENDAEGIYSKSNETNSE
jgi:hypothetical protein